MLRYYARTIEHLLTTPRPDPLMLDSAVEGVFLTRSPRSQTLKTLASRYGMRKPHSFARRFIAGETVDEAIARGAGGRARRA